MDERQALIAEFVELSGEPSDADWLATADMADLRDIVAGARAQRMLIETAFDGVSSDDA
jgi:hypothetical protein